MNDGLVIHDDPDRIADTGAPSVHIQERIFTEIIDAHEAHLEADKDRTKLWRWFGFSGWGAGLLGLATVLVVTITYQPQYRYSNIDTESGQIRLTYSAKDAPEHFPESTIKRYLADFVNERERFVWQIDSDTDYRVKLMSSPEEQLRYAADRDKENPMKRYGLTGYKRIKKIGDMRFRARGKDKTYEYEVPFIKAEVFADNPQKVIETRMTAYVMFQFHPELNMTDQDRLKNEAGFYAISYRATED